MKALVLKGAVNLLLNAAQEFKDDSSTVSWVYLALKQLAVNDDSVKLVSIVSLSDMPLVLVPWNTFPSGREDSCSHPRMYFNLLGSAHPKHPRRKETC